MKKPMEQEDIREPRYFTDLNLDQIVKDIMVKKKPYDLRRFYYEKPDPTDICYRQEVLKDLENDKLFQEVMNFSLGMRKAKEYLNNSKDTDSTLQRNRLKLDAAYLYLNCVRKLYDTLTESELKSQGLQLFQEWLETYWKGEELQTFHQDTEILMKRFDEIQYNLQLKQERIIIKQGYEEGDYCKELMDTFHKEPSSERLYMTSPFGTTKLSSLESALLEILARFYGPIFEDLEEYDKKYKDFINETLIEFELEIQFYVAFRLYLDEMKEMNFHFCYPSVGVKDLRLLECYDLALAKKNAKDKKEVVFNDCYYEKDEMFLIVTGPNQGGKTTYARAVGQILYFGMLGLMVPARTAELPIYDNIYTHFATDESMETGAGKLKEEVIRLKALMDGATKNSFVLINEIFTSATSYDAYIMGKRVIDHFIKEACHGIYVTHIHELTKSDGQIVSMVATLLNENSNIRTFKIERKVADGKSYANSIVEKYRMTYPEIKERISQ